METELGQQLNNPHSEVEAGGFTASTGTEQELGQQLNNPHPPTGAERELGQQPNNPHPEVEAGGFAASTGTERELGKQLNNPLPEVEAGGSAASSGTKRRGRKPSLTLDEKKRKKIASDRNYRRSHKEELDRLRKIVSEYGGMDKLEDELQGLKRLKFRCREIGEMMSKLNKVEQAWSDLQRLKGIGSTCGGSGEIDFWSNELEQLKARIEVLKNEYNMFAGEINNMQSELLRLDETEFWRPFMPKQTEMALIDRLQSSSDFLEVQSIHEEHSVNLNNQGSSGNSGMVQDDGIRDMSHAVETPYSDASVTGFFAEFEKNTSSSVNFSSFKDLDGERQRVGEYSFPNSLVHGICDMSLAVETPYSDVLVTDFIAKLETNTRSYVDFSSFKDLDGERQRVGSYSFPMSLVSTVNAIMEAHGDVTRNCLLGPSAVENTYILLCAAIKEMGELPLKQVTEEIMLKWRDAIRDAIRIGFDVEFAWQHLKTIAYGYFGLKARNYWTSLEKKIIKLMGDQKSLRQKLEKKKVELKVINAEVEELTSSQCKTCLDCADGFMDKNVGLFG